MNLPASWLPWVHGSPGLIVANDNMRTSNPDVFAIGDVLGPDKVMLTHVASKTIHAHPTLAEAMLEVSLKATDRALYG